MPGWHEPAAPTWVRRCDGCGAEDRRAAFGATALAAADPWWRCPGCGHGAWTPAVAHLPGGAAPRPACPAQAARS